MFCILKAIPTRARLINRGVLQPDLTDPFYHAPDMAAEAYGKYLPYSAQMSSGPLPERINQPLDMVAYSSLEANGIRFFARKTQYRLKTNPTLPREVLWWEVFTAENDDPATPGADEYLHPRVVVAHTWQAGAQEIESPVQEIDPGQRSDGRGRYYLVFAPELTGLDPSGLPLEKPDWEQTGLPLLRVSSGSTSGEAMVALQPNGLAGARYSFDWDDPALQVYLEITRLDDDGGGGNTSNTTLQAGDIAQSRAGLPQVLASAASTVMVSRALQNGETVNAAEFAGAISIRLRIVGDPAVLAAPTATLHLFAQDAYENAVGDSSLKVGRPPEMMVDGNRDGEMAFDNAIIHDKDGTTAENPHRFWCNDDQDVQTTSLAWSDPDPETIPVVTKDYSDNRIQGSGFAPPDTRDLEDFTRLWISFKGIAEMVKTGALQLKLEWKPNDGTANWPTAAGNPGIKVYQAVETDGGRKYIEDQTWGYQQLQMPYDTMLADVHRGSAVPLPLRASTLAGLSESNPNVYLLFEGSSEGKGQLVLTLHQGTQKIGEYPPLYLDIKDIKKMYERAHTTPLQAQFPFPYEQGASPSSPYQAAPSGALFIPDSNINYGLGNGPEAASNLPFEKPPGEENKCIVFVHGIDMDIPTYYSYSESCFKRLWWAGYKGRFCAFRWGTPLSGTIGADIFNDGEMRAWSYGPSLKNYITYVADQMSGARISVIGHSLGNAVVGSAFERGMVVDSYIAMEAAVSLSCYFPPASAGQADPLANSFLPQLTTADASKPTPNNYPELGYRGFLRNLPNGIQGKLTAYQNQRDFWLATGTTRFGIQKVDWVTNQKDYKPNSLHGTNSLKQYTFNGSHPLGQQCALLNLATSPRYVQDPHEAMAYIARSRTPALGAEPPNLNPRPPNWRVPVDMEATYNFNSPRFDHSGQFQRNIQLMYWDTTTNTPFATPFYKRLLQDLNMAQE